MFMYKMLFKRIIDVILSFCGLFIISPFLFIFVFVLFIANEGFPFYLQDRPGENGKIFRLIKFKTMSDERDSEGNLLPDEIRVSALGRFMRNYSLDEYPQLINVLKGDMSLIGPRPLRQRPQQQKQP